MSDGRYVDTSYWFYAPNKGAAIFFSVAFCSSGCLHIYQCIRYKCWRLTPLFPFCAILFTVGFVLRVYGAFHYNNLNIFIASICINYAAPPLLELQNYRILGRILYYVPYHSPIHPGRVLTTFGFISGIIEALNGWGASYSANQSLTNKEIETGHALIKASLLLQIIVAVLFIALVAVFYRRCTIGGISNESLNQSLCTLCISIILILSRTVYRVVEYFSVAELRYGPNLDPASIKAVVRYEWYFYVFEATVMLINITMFNVRHPRRYLPKNNKIYLAPDSTTYIEGPGYKDPRKFWQTLFDPLDIQGMVSGRGRKTERFWETFEEQGTESTKNKSTDPGAV
ncbi:hypothetical protein BKA59DRAFT_178276 [Fusarium tricinctum]|uniref:Rtm1p n=1 Tax=Fusarium tricinctum TaxID=61284 RepID=A0A8K0WCA5_9HYPO|nr:hypothetical protein BKA59DRAFT_178276 [Fusarium tricinctum]